MAGEIAQLSVDRVSFLVGRDYKFGTATIEMQTLKRVKRVQRPRAPVELARAREGETVAPASANLSPAGVLMLIGGTPGCKAS